MRETTARLISKEEVDYFKEDKTFIEFIVNDLTKTILKRLNQVLETNDEIIVKKPALRVSEYQPTNAVEYRKTVDWEPLVRCKDCIYFEPDDVSDWGLCRSLGAGFEKNGFCSEAERRTENETD